MGTVAGFKAWQMDSSKALIPVMRILDHWHPVLASKDLKTTPVEVTLAGQPLVLFRNAQGMVGAVRSRCPHRGMNLSRGEIHQDWLVCPYHGWRFDAQGQGNSPCNPTLKVSTEAFDVREACQYIWLTRRDSQAPFPDFELPDYRIIGIHARRIQTPLEPVMDNFLEVEHFPKAHQWLGYGFKQITEAHVVTAFLPDRVTVGFYPTEPLYWLVRKLFNLPSGFLYFMDITVHFSPVYSVHHQGWLNHATGDKSSLLINVVFYVPVNGHETNLVMFLLTKKGPWDGVKNHFIRQKTGALIDDDLKILNHLADKYMATADMQLGFHDKALVEVRTRLKSIYRDYYQAPPVG